MTPMSSLLADWNWWQVQVDRSMSSAIARVVGETLQAAAAATRAAKAFIAVPPRSAAESAPPFAASKGARPRASESLSFFEMQVRGFDDAAELGDVGLDDVLELLGRGGAPPDRPCLKLPRHSAT